MLSVASSIHFSARFLELQTPRKAVVPDLQELVATGFSSSTPLKTGLRWISSLELKVDYRGLVAGMVILVAGISGVLGPLAVLIVFVPSGPCGLAR